MPNFAVFHIPPAHDDFYKIGSAILGYDIRAKSELTIPKTLKYDFDEFNPHWCDIARPYGFHMTIGDAVRFKNKSVLAKVEKELSTILGWISPRNPLSLNWREEKFLTYWRYEKSVVVLRYHASEALKILHTLVTSRINPLGDGSGYHDEYKQFPEDYSPHRASRIKNFYSPTVFDSYSPHFTLLNPYKGDHHRRLKKRLRRRFAAFTHIPVHTISLVVQWADDQPWEIHREFVRDPYTMTWKTI